MVFFDEKENKAYKESDVAFFILLNEEDIPVGRIVSFVDHVRNKERSINQGGIGFFRMY